MPCADVEAYNSLHTKTEFALRHSNQSHDKQNDLCSPFCACSCCNVVLTYFPTTTFNFPILTEIIKVQLPTYKSIVYSNFYGSIWQPPQIA